MGWLEGIAYASLVNRLGAGGHYGDAMDNFVEYERLKESGRSPLEACQEALLASEHFFFAIRMLRRVYGLELAEARDVAQTAEASKAGKCG